MTFKDGREPEEFTSGDNDFIRLGWECVDGEVVISRWEFTQPHGEFVAVRLRVYPESEVAIAAHE